MVAQSWKVTADRVSVMLTGAWSSFTGLRGSPLKQKVELQVQFG